MKWYEIKTHRPPHGELIWVWDANANRKMLIRYMASEGEWIRNRDNTFPIWAHLNEEEAESDTETVSCCAKCWNEKIACVCMSEEDECQ